ncbi:ABC-2 type transport system ATP-binding protein [Nakamurella flavida]|nr:ABC transporter ATP-binding protein [Nakamurella flavida]MDP9778494.1 ABC-2 type transport system ATP-binding protein [Nakamurella flavida]
MSATTAVETPLEAVDVGRRFRRGWALRNCSFALREGRITALVGPNGAGKSTLMAMATGLLEPTEGRIDVRGATVDTKAMHPALGYLAQDKPLYRRMRVRDMVTVTGRLNRRWDEPRALRLIEDAQVPMTARIGSLSGGQRSRLALALVLARRPSVLLLDEPLADLDPLARVEMQQTLLTEVMDTGMTVLLSSHIISEIQDTCDDLLLVRSGGITLNGAVEDILGSHQVLVGPGTADGVGGLGWLPASGVVEINHAARQTTVLLDGTPPPLPVGWSQAPATLDEVVMAHLRIDRDGARPPADGVTR